MSNPRNPESEKGNLALAERAAQRPPQGRVVILNDDYTPMEFVVEVLRDYFDMSGERAEGVMIKVHTEGRGVCGTYPLSDAQARAASVVRVARSCGYPLCCVVEKIKGDA